MTKGERLVQRYYGKLDLDMDMDKERAVRNVRLYKDMKALKKIETKK